MDHTKVIRLATVIGGHLGPLCRGTDWKLELAIQENEAAYSNDFMTVFVLFRDDELVVTRGTGASAPTATLTRVPAYAVASLIRSFLD